MHVRRQPRRSTSRSPGAEAGDALVVDVGDFRELGYWGEVLTTAAQARGLSGLVIDGGVRDITEIQAHGFPVFSTMIALRGATKSRTGSIRAPIQCGGVLVEPGDWVVGDADGVVVVPEATLADVINAGRVRAAKEAAMFRALWEGRTTLELLGPRPVPDPGRRCDEHGDQGADRDGRLARSRELPRRDAGRCSARSSR